MVAFASKVPGNIIPVDIVPGQCTWCQIWLQSMPLSSLAHAIEPYLPVAAEAVGAGAVGAAFSGMMRD